MTTATYLVGDVFDRLAEIPDGTIDLVMTSPPFLALRSYLPPDHPDKGKEIGSEPTPAAFLDTLLALTAEWGRVLAPHGSICVELGDTYAGSGGAGGDYNPNGLRDGQSKFDGSNHRRGRIVDHDSGRRTPAPGWPLDKSLCGIPDAYALSLEYGRNILRAPLTARELLAVAERMAADHPDLDVPGILDYLLGYTEAHEARGRGPGIEIEPWRVRNKVAWVRPNPPVGALGDKFRPATSYLTIATRARDRYFDLDAVRTPSVNPIGVGVRPTQARVNGNDEHDNRNSLGPYTREMQSAGAPPLDWWNIPPTGYPGAHYAVYPPELCTRPILTMTPQRVCLTCGQPSRRITDPFTLDSYRASDRPQTIKAVALADQHGLTDDHIAAIRAFGTSDAGKAPALNNGAGKNSAEVNQLAAEAKAVLGGYFREFVQSTTAERTSTWSDCGHNTWRPGHVLDPFAGTGTTLAVATGHARHATGIDLDPRNAQLALERVGMFLTIDHGTQQETA